MGSFFDTQVIELTCPHCSQKVKQTIAWFKNSGNACPHCAALIDSSQFASGLKKAEKSLADLRDTIKKAGKRK